MERGSQYNASYVQTSPLKRSLDSGPPASPRKYAKLEPTREEYKHGEDGSSSSTSQVKPEQKIEFQPSADLVYACDQCAKSLPASTSYSTGFPGTLRGSKELRGSQELLSLNLKP